jgi:hypothetical protein
VQALNTLQSNAAAVKAVRDSGPISSSQAISEVIDLAARIGYKVGHPGLLGSDDEA